jgi:hypothetical protein
VTATALTTEASGADVASPEDLSALKLIAERSPEGMAVPSSTIREAGIGAATLRNLQLEELVEVVDDDGDPALTITAAGLEALHEQRSR